MSGDFVDFGGLDPAVADLTKQGERRRDRSPVARKKRDKEIQEKRRAKARLARRVNWDLPPELKDRINALAEDHRTPASQVAAVLLAYGLAALERDDLDLDDYKTPSDSPRYDWNLSLENADFFELRDALG